MVKACGACRLELPKEVYSGTQWKLSQHQRRCRSCVEGGRPLPGASKAGPPPSSAHSADADEGRPCEGGGPRCWICLEEGPDDAGGPLRRDCSCRGESSGWAHASCLVEYADKKTWHYISYISPVKHNHLIDFEVLRSAYEKCPCCKNWYENNLAVDMASAFVAFVEKHYPGRKSYRRNLLEALQLKLNMLSFMSARASRGQKDEAKRIGRRMFAAIEELRGQPGSDRVNCERMEMGANFMLGQIWRSEGREGALRSIEYFERSISIGNRIGDAEHNQRAELQLSVSRKICFGADEASMARDIAKRKEDYTRQIADAGRDATSTMVAGRNLAFILLDANRTIEAMRLLGEVEGICTRVHGADHHLTQQIRFHYKEKRRIQVPFLNEGNFVFAEALHYKDGTNDQGSEEIVVLGPIASRKRDKDKQGEFSVPWSEVLLPPGTPVSVKGLRNAAHLNGKIGDVRRWDEKTDRYEVYFEQEDLKPALVKLKNLEIIFELPVDGLDG